MIMLHILTEELSCKKVLETLLPKEYQSKKILRNIDRIQNAPQLILSMVPELSNRKTLPKLEIAEKIAGHLSLEKNKSVSFNYFFKGLQKLLMMNQHEL